MNKKSRKSEKQSAGACLCQGVGPVLSELVRRLAPPAAARGHFETARLEFLKGLRALLDARIEQCSKPRSKGEKISVE
ncbi:MAG TPA: hypothetical protein VNZ64_12550 [Candidatus Acidoferrum sp.]|jgi:hypothetical protein|nr:hypothetical protein [Candidatus Acidoferrum sp.]